MPMMTPVSNSAGFCHINLQKKYRI